MLNPEDLGKLARALDMTSEEELACDECFEELDRFVEMELAGLDAAAAMPLVQDHLDKCGDCREEYQRSSTLYAPSKDGLRPGSSGLGCAGFSGRTEAQTNRDAYVPLISLRLRELPARCSDLRSG